VIEPGIVNLEIRSRFWINGAAMRIRQDTGLINDPARELVALLARFNPAIRTLVREARTTLRRRMPTAIELVYDNARALAIGFASSERTSDTIVSLAVYTRGVNLYFMYGAALRDPNHLLLGSGNQGRFVRLESAEMLDRDEIDDLLAAAIAEGDTPLPASGRGRFIIKSVSPARRTGTRLRR
jgi:hypothetical protein